MRSISPAGFLLGALLAAMAAAIKIIFLNDAEERRAGRSVERPVETHLSREGAVL